MTTEALKIDSSPKRPAIGARHFVETFATSVALHGCALVQGVILARVLGPDGRGDFAAVILWPNIVANIGLLGTNMAVTRLAASGDDVGPLARTGILLSLILSFVTVTAGVLMLPFLVPETDSDILGLARLYMILFVPAYILLSNLSGVDQGRANFRRLNFFRLLQNPVYVCMLVILIVFGWANLRYCLCALLIAFWITTLGRFFLLIKKVPLFGSLISPVKLLHDGIPYAIVNAVAQLTHRGDRILLLWLLTDYDLGLYVVAYSAAGVLGNLPLSMGFVSLTIAAQEKPGEGFDRIAKIFRGAVIISFAAGIILSFGVYFLLPLVYGQDFSGARITAILLAAGTILFGLTSLLSQSLKGQGKPMAGMVSRLAGLAAMAVVAFLLHRPLGINGVAIGFVVAQIISLFGIMLLTVQHYQSASLAMMFPRMTDVKTVSLSLKQQGVRLLRKFGIFRTVGGSDSSTPGISSND